MANLKDWTGRVTSDMIHITEDRTEWCRIVNDAAHLKSCGA